MWTMLLSFIWTCESESFYLLGWHRQKKAFHSFTNDNCISAVIATLWNLFKDFSLSSCRHVDVEGRQFSHIHSVVDSNRKNSLIFLHLKRLKESKAGKNLIECLKTVIMKREAADSQHETWNAKIAFRNQRNLKIFHFIAENAALVDSFVVAIWN